MPSESFPCHRAIIFLILFAILTFMLAAPIQAQQKGDKKKIAKENKIIITGSLAGDDGNPAKNFIVQFFEVSGDGVKLKIREGEIKNPTAITGDDGSFVINVGLNLFGMAEEFIVFARSNEFNSKFAQLRDTDGKVIKFRVAEKSKIIKLGKVSVK